MSGERAKLEYKALKRKYLIRAIIGVIVWIILQFVLIFLGAGNTAIWIVYLLFLAYLLLCSVQLRLRISNLLFQDINLDVYRYYVEILKPAKKPEYAYLNTSLKCNLEIAEGNFEKANSALEKLSESVDSQRVSAFNQIVILRQFLITALYMSDEKKYEQLLEELHSVEVKNKRATEHKDAVIKEVEAIHDLIIEKRPNPYFETRPSKNKLSYLQNLYYKGLNAKFNGNIDAAQNCFQEISQENSQLFIVKRAKAELGNV